MTRAEQRQRAYRRLHSRLSADGELAAWRPLRIDDEREIAPRWFVRAVRAARQPVHAPPAPMRSVRPRERREGRRRHASTAAPPDAGPHLAKPASGYPLHIISFLVVGELPVRLGPDRLTHKRGEAR